MKTLEEFYEEVNEYIDSKIPDVDLSVRREIAVFVAQRAGIRERDLVEDVAQQFRYSMKIPTRMSKSELVERSKYLAELRKKQLKEN